MKPCAIFDIDGTLADCTHRLPLIRGRDRDYRSFYADSAILADKPKKPVIETMMLVQFGLGIALLTGRPKSTRAATMRWLEIHAPSLDVYTLLMREDADRRPSEIVKREHLAKLEIQGLRPLIAFDDNPDDLSMYEAAGIQGFLVPGWSVDR